jgi:hypothetical protein
MRGLRGGLFRGRGYWLARRIWRGWRGALRFRLRLVRGDSVSGSVSLEVEMGEEEGRRGRWKRHTVTLPSKVCMNSLSDAKFCSISLSVDRLMRIVRASFAICCIIPYFISPSPLLVIQGDETHLIIPNQELQVFYRQQLVRLEYARLCDRVRDKILDGWTAALVSVS